MNRTRPIVFSLSLIAVSLWFAVGTRVVAGDDWLPVPPADLALKDNPASPGADAMILYRRSHVDARRAAIDGDFDEEYVRIKIFTQKGVESEANPAIRFFKGDSDIRDIRARTIRPDGSVVNFDGKVYEKIAEKTGESTYLTKTFALSSVVPGCIVEYKYRQVFKPLFVYGEEWVISGRLFTRDANFSIAPYVPRSSLDPTLYFRSTGLPKGAPPQRQGDGSYAMGVHDIPGITEEPLMPPARSLEARVEFFYRNRSEPTGETAEQFWNRTAKKSSDELDKFVNKGSALEHDLSQTVDAGDTPEVKLQKIYARVQKIRNLDFEPARTAAEQKAEEIKPNESAEDVLKHNYANGRQINWLFIGLTRTAGLEASAVFLAPRNRDVFMPNGQNFAPLTADVVWARAGGKEYWLDPAALCYPFGLLPWYESESKGVRVTRQGAEFVESPASTSANATIMRSADLQLKDDGSASGKLQEEFTGGSGARWRTAHYRDDDTGRRKALEDEIRRSLPAGSTFVVSNIVNWDKTAEPLHVEGDVTVPTLGSLAGHRMLAPIALFWTNFGQDFVAEQRVNPIYFSYRFEQRDDVKIHAPAGLKIGTTPPGKAINPGPSMSYEISATAQGDVVEVKRHFALNDIHFPADSYAALRSFFGSMKSSDEVQLVFESSGTTKSN